jgi:hypothetical protein
MSVNNWHIDIWEATSNRHRCYIYRCCIGSLNLIWFLDTSSPSSHILQQIFIVNVLLLSDTIAKKVTITSFLEIPHWNPFFEAFVWHTQFVLIPKIHILSSDSINTVWLRKNSLNVQCRQEWNFLSHFCKFELFCLGLLFLYLKPLQFIVCFHLMVLFFF